MKTLNILIVGVGLLLFCSGCKKAPSPSPANPTLNLSAVYNAQNNSVALSWKAVNISNFDQFILVRSTNPLADEPTPQSNSLPFLEKFTFENINVHTYLDDNLPLITNVHYKLYMRSEDQFIFSQSITIKTKIEPLPFCYFHSALIPQTDHLLITDMAGSLYKFDIIEQELIAGTEVDLVYPTIRIGDAGNGLEAFVFSDFDSTLFILDPSDMTIKKEVNVGSKLYDLDTHNNGFLFLTQPLSGESLRTVRRSDFSTISTANEQTFNYERRVKLLKQTDDFVMEISGTTITRHQFNEEGVFTDSSSKEFDFQGIVNRDVPVSPSGDFFVPRSRIQVFNTDLMVTAEHSGNAVSYLFSADEERLYFAGDHQTFQMDLDQGPMVSIDTSYTPNLLIEKADSLIAIVRIFLSEHTCSFSYPIEKN